MHLVDRCFSSDTCFERVDFKRKVTVDSYLIGFFSSTLSRVRWFISYL